KKQQYSEYISSSIKTSFYKQNFITRCLWQESFPAPQDTFCNAEQFRQEYAGTALTRYYAL
ncbi:MAG TPA: hypothetical protein VN512_11285, partial [Clostridia bacterium]|nr:hypothetical protein [Clostridia bacterium]